MTLIECFTPSHIDNIAACLRLEPEQLIMIGKEDEMADPVELYTALFRKRGLRTKVTMCNVGGMDFGEICNVLDKLVRNEPDCVIDLTGGDEPVIMAVGAVLSHLDGKKRQNVRVEKFHHDLDAVLDCVNHQRKLPCRSAELTVEELIAIHGGTLHPNAYQPPASSTRKELDGLWRIVSDDPKEWNRQVMLLNQFESRSDSKTHIYLPLEHIRRGIPNFDEKEATVRDLLGKLHHYGVIEDRSNYYALEYTYTSPLLRYCTQKAGNVLEVKTLLEGRAVSENGATLFGDCRMSVNIDWDGVVHNPMKRIPETRNEIDVVLMHGLTPLFISCKNGDIGEEELYKLHTVATCFGGPYAKKMLIATNLERKNPASDRAFIQRAWDMDILLVTDAGELSREEWKQVFLKAIG